MEAQVDDLSKSRDAEFAAFVPAISGLSFIMANQDIKEGLLACASNVE